MGNSVVKERDRDSTEKSQKVIILGCGESGKV
jgi:hypothetical protein